MYAEHKAQNTLHMTSPPPRIRQDSLFQTITKPSACLQPTTHNHTSALTKANPFPRSPKLSNRHRLCMAPRGSLGIPCPAQRPRQHPWRSLHSTAPGLHSKVRYITVHLSTFRPSDPLSQQGQVISATANASRRARSSAKPKEAIRRIGLAFEGSRSIRRQASTLRSPAPTDRASANFPLRLFRAPTGQNKASRMTAQCMFVNDS